jgi:SAM-dependent methyltransferase
LRLWAILAYRLAPHFLSWLKIPAGQRWLDIGCGTGALCEAIVEQCSPSALFGVEPSAKYLEAASQNLGGSASFHLGSATSLPLADGSIDAVVSGLVLNFIPDPVVAPSYLLSLSEESKIRLRDRIKENLPTSEDGSILLTARAWAVRGLVSKKLRKSSSEIVHSIHRYF